MIRDSLHFAQNDKPGIDSDNALTFHCLADYVPLAQIFTGVCRDLALNSGMLRGGLVLALGLFGICFTVTAQQHRVGASSVTPLDTVSGLNLYRPGVVSACNASLLLHSGPVRAWSDGAQLVSQTALAQVGMAPLGLFPVAYLAPSDVAPMSAKRTAGPSDLRFVNPGMDAKELPTGMMDSPLNHVYYTGEVGFLYGRWSGKGDGDYFQTYVWGQAGNDKFQITAGASYDEWNGNGRSVRFRSFGPPR